MKSSLQNQSLYAQRLREIHTKNLETLLISSEMFTDDEKMKASSNSIYLLQRPLSMKLNNDCR